ncbi:hypothetical protein PHYBLDRAFT_163519 [Phycomyces blakesleeanus NRRL 1555(-)]|uniref:Uncharacterized protein n=1 Tax=Phycomyces blakesleeanus (strain ATCC 8743b / DSM 1359 / FGSC 10004 / NBRC 33097 / NRRL 1555) TaxID=763407 RepID=A0A162UW91_PHYB8|nr:hypothetical protein PHYBLDRAFT_163519 [Phycomyces blakesleeanus NRRL 1555(-)]OAD78403.1 hypothetical protein PHYBLDRAFT_163519 [Phycomyces blakesleeanus NRRL 1555(-)]|eukprot:XP_018296443.1 hypothetical protein PHYBLDRAFT_163519 [Phycomyces blakesleeanus NRRL 1555(-)]
MVSASINKSQKSIETYGDLVKYFGSFLQTHHRHFKVDLNETPHKSGTAKIWTEFLFVCQIKGTLLSNLHCFPVFQFSRFRTIFLNELYQNQTPPCHSELNEPLDKSREQKFGTKCEFAHQIKCTLLTNLLLSGYRAIGLSGYRDSGLYF